MLQLSGHFTYRKLLRYTFPSIVMLVFNSFYYVVDGLFVSNWVGKTPFAAINFIWPTLMLLGSFGFMFGTGGSALIGKTMGEQNLKKANEIFSLLIYVSIGCGTVVAIVGILLLRPIASALGAEGELLTLCTRYGSIYLLSLPAYLLQSEFQCLCSTAGKPKLGLYTTVAAGVANIVLDALFIIGFSWGVAGAAAASSLSQCIGGLLPLLYFCRKNSSPLHLTRTSFDWQSLSRICSNGFSELLNNISMSIVGILYNFQLLRIVGEDGIAAYGVLMYVNLVFIGIFIGYSVGSAPIVSYHYGAENHAELKNLLRKGLAIISVSSLLMFAAGELLARPLSVLYAGYDPELLKITMRGFFIYSFSFLFAGFAILGSSFFTALNNGLVSALISFLRTMVFQVAGVMLLPLIWDLDGVWMSIGVAEFLAALVTFLLLFSNRKRYGY